MYEVNPWLWQFGRGRPRLGGLSVTETEERRVLIARKGAVKSHETRRRRKAARRGQDWTVRNEQVHIQEDATYPDMSWDI